MTDSDLAELNRKISVMQAYRDGEEIQLIGEEARDWQTWPHLSSPKWNWHLYDYRVKPVEPRIIWVHANCDGSVSTRHTSECPPCPSIPFVEMTPSVREKLGL